MILFYTLSSKIPIQFSKNVIAIKKLVRGSPLIKLNNLSTFGKNDCIFILRLE